MKELVWYPKSVTFIVNNSEEYFHYSDEDMLTAFLNQNK